MTALSHSRWIWYTSQTDADSYGDFSDTFDYRDGTVECNITCDGDYTLWINGSFVSSGQYGDFEHYKIYDTLDITPFVKAGENQIKFLVWHLGAPSSRYRPAVPGLLYEVVCEGKIVAKSGEHTLCRKNPNYKSGYLKKITNQLGMSFLFDATVDTDLPYTAATLIEKETILFPRPIPKHALLPKKEAECIVADKNHYLFDLKGETVGLPTLSFYSKEKQTITVAWGEHIEDGCVRRHIDGRDFSFEYIASIGHNDYTNYMLRLGARYLEVFSESPIEMEYCTLIPQVYPVTETNCGPDDPLDKQIYDICVNTLKLCMMEHYVDTPWREQCFYSFDSRNQMLCGYRVFEDKNQQYARANLMLAAMDRRSDGLLSLTAPSGRDSAIPSFSLHYIIAVREYLEHTGDLSLGFAVFGKITGIVDAFLAREKDGLLYPFTAKGYWNFYDWSAHLNVPAGTLDAPPDAMLNGLFVLALHSFRRICFLLDKPFAYETVLSRMRMAVKAAFYHPENGLFSMTAGGEEYTELVNAVAYLANLTDPDESERLIRALRDGKLLPCSLSNKCFKYDALLCHDEGNRPAVLDEIRRTYKVMLDAGSTTVWETAIGAADFGNAGSLCHGWSAVPVLYLL